MPCYEEAMVLVAVATPIERIIFMKLREIPRSYRHHDDSSREVSSITPFLFMFRLKDGCVVADKNSNHLKYPSLWILRQFSSRGERYFTTVLLFLSSFFLPNWLRTSRSSHLWVIYRPLKYCILAFGFQTGCSFSRHFSRFFPTIS